MAKRLFCARLGELGLCNLGGVLFWEKCVGGLNVFMGENEESSLGIVEPTPTKAMDNFLRIRKKIDPMVKPQGNKTNRAGHDWQC